MHMPHGPAEPVLTVDNLAVTIDADAGPIRAVDGISFGIGRGEVVALVGESGSGKSITAQAILGILPKRARIEGGSILFRDPAHPAAPADIAALDPSGQGIRALRGNRITMIFQEPMTSLSPLHTVGDQVTEVLRLHRNAGKAEAAEAAMAVFARVGFAHPKRLLTTYPFELSGGMRQRAMIAMALVCKPALLVADEPTTALDVTTQALILDLMLELQAETGMGLLLITHDLGIVANMAHQVVVLYRGRVMERGSRSDIFRDPRHPYLKALMNAVPRFDMPAGERLTPIRPIRVEAGDALKAGWAEGGCPADRPILAVEGATKTYTLRAGWFGGRSETVRAVSGVGLALYPGRTVGLVGESGSGKTTMAKLVMRALHPDGGRIVYDDGSGPVDIKTLSGPGLKAYRRAVQFVFQDPFSSLNPRMTVNDILTEPLIIHDVCSEGERNERVKTLLELVGLDQSMLRRYPHSFSGGQRQRLGIARALILKPRVLLCDEPVSALDVSVQAQILNLLKDLQRELGLSYLFISHNLAVVDYVADDIAVMCRGHIVEQASRALLFRNPRHPYTKALLAAVPSPDLTRPLDFATLRQAGFSDPAAWPAPFTIRADLPEPVMAEVESGHFVRVSDHALAREAA